MLKLASLFAALIAIVDVLSDNLNDPTSVLGNQLSRAETSTSPAWDSLQLQFPSRQSMELNSHSQQAC